MSKVRYVDTQTYPLVSSATVTAGDFVKLTNGSVEKDTTSMSQNIIGQAIKTVTDNSAVTGTTDYVPVVRAGRIAVTGMVEGSGGTYKTAIGVGDYVSLYVSSGVQYLVAGGSSPIGKVIYGSVASSGTVADTTGTIEVDLNVEMESIEGTEITFPLTIPTATATYCMDLNAGTFTIADFRLQNGATIANSSATTLVITETNIELVGAIALSGIVTLDNGATLDNTSSATTLTITETNIELVGAIKLNGAVTLDDDGTITDAANVMTITQDTITLSGATAINVTGVTTTVTASTLGVIYSPDIRFGYDVGSYMKVAVADTTGVTAVTFAGSGVTYTLTAPTISLVGAIKLDGTVTFDDDGTIVDAANVMTLTQDTIALAGATAISLTGADVSLVGAIKLDGGVTFDDDATLTDAANVTTLTQETITLAGATKINLDGPTTVTGIFTVDTAGSPADGILISAVTPVDGLEISSVCSGNAINISGAGVTGINIGTCSSYGILMEGTYVNGIRLTTSVDTTNHTGIRVLNTYTAADGYHTAIMGAAVYDPTATGYGAVIGVYGEANINGEFTGGTNWSFGVRGTLQLRDDTVLNNASSIFGAINASMKDDATPTLTAGHVCGIYVENLIDADLSTISGIATMMYIANNSSATCTLNSAIYLYGPKITYFTQFDTDCNVSGCISAVAPSAAASRYISVEIEGAAYKILAQSVA